MKLLLACFCVEMPVEMPVTRVRINVKAHTASRVADDKNMKYSYPKLRILAIILILRALLARLPSNICNESAWYCRAYHWSQSKK